MQVFYIIVSLSSAYLIGSLPMGLYIVKLVSGKDIRLVQSGRTGGTNAMRAAGFWAGLATAILDVIKGASGVWLAQALVPRSTFLAILAPIVVIIGHNYSIFLVEKDDRNKLHFRGGAGGGPTAGGAMALWPPILLIIIPVGVVILFGIGYASLTTLSIPIIAIIVFSIRASMGISPWTYVIYGVLAEIILVWGLRPNIKRLLNGTERIVGWRAKHMNRNKKNLRDKSVGLDSNNA